MRYASKEKPTIILTKKDLLFFLYCFPLKTSPYAFVSRLDLVGLVSRVCVDSKLVDLDLAVHFSCSGSFPCVGCSLGPPSIYKENSESA